jgi:hypothetical protein
MKCPTCSQPVPRDATGLVQASVASRVLAEWAARNTAQELGRLLGYDYSGPVLSLDEVWGLRRPVDTG